MPKTYTTIQGDTWDIIAYKVYSNEKQMAVLIDANPAHRETVFFSSGVELVVPEIIQPASNKLPAWKR